MDVALGASVVAHVATLCREDVLFGDATTCVATKIWIDVRASETVDTRSLTTPETPCSDI